MKLNKVLALALSGVMAVSMLAGCSGNPADGEQGGDQGEVVVDANDISDGVKSFIDDLPEYVTFNGDSKLTDSLDYIVEFVTWEGIPANKLNAVVWGDLQNRLEKSVGATKGIDIDNIGDDDVLLKAESVSDVKIDDAKAVQLYVASGVIEGNALNTLVAEAIQNTVTSYVHTVRSDAEHIQKPGHSWWHPDFDRVDGNNGIYDHSYTVSVSTSAKTVAGVESTFVAVQVVRSSVRS